MVLHDVKGAHELAGKLAEIFHFLLRNRHFNETVQHAAYRRDVLPWPDTASKLVSLLHSKANTQASGSLDDLGETWQSLHENYEHFERIETIEDLASALWLIADPEKKRPKAKRSVLDEMWTALTHAKGFGGKTAALFVKSIVDIHTLDVNKDLSFLHDFTISSEDFLMVPVDRVILHIFTEIGLGSPSFTKINGVIREYGLQSSRWPTLWDDLWFWGFITQRMAKIAPTAGEKEVSTMVRRTELNEPKFWSILGTPAHLWPQVREAAEEFRTIVTSPALLPA
ncbi:hypothetical protein KRR38_31405 [Novosphingobium sp. G106]|uniref:hypothetical protein n=1 Tax=Novosphingobium sp. G106 TaxID=2849500 RepID=UPI001C2D3DFE|nr:hypothetical protein [Novosphingobium sp. G106]MBV1692056.1 hypothetical protein [Novosphingobium sp. G106]